jgi:glycosyltransferase involved in cell wall biosynthesis
VYYSLVVPCYNDRKALELLLKSYNPPDDGFEFIVVDDGSTDGTEDMAKNYPARYIKMEKNSGPAAARNRGVQEAKGDVIIFCDSDIVLDKEALGLIKKYFEEKGVVSMLASGLLPPPNKGFFPLFKHYLEESWLDNNRVEETEHFSARLGAIKKDLFLKAGGFEENITSASVEDFEFGHRLGKFTRSKICYDVKFSHRHPGFWKQARLFFARSADYFNVMMARRGLDNIGASSKEAGIAITGFLSQLCLPLLLISGKFIFPSIFFFLWHILLSRKLCKITFTQKGFFFTLMSVAVNYILAFFIVTGVGWGIMRYTLKKIFSRGAD